MELSLTTPAVLFPAVSLLMLAYTNRFLAIANIVRGLVSRSEAGADENVRLQIKNLSKRIGLIKAAQAFGIASLFTCVLSILFLYIEFIVGGKILFAVSLFLMLASLAMSFWEITLSGSALTIELQRIAPENKQK